MAAAVVVKLDNLPDAIKKSGCGQYAAPHAASYPHTKREESSYLTSKKNCLMK